MIGRTQSDLHHCNNARRSSPAVPRPALVSLVLSLAKIQTDAVRYVGILLAVIVYGFFGTPTPDSFGFAEILIGVLLVLAVDIHRILIFPQTDMRHDWPLWYSAGLMLLVYGLGCSMIVAVTHGNPVHLIIRDLVAFAFIMLPVLMAPLRQTKCVRSFSVSLLLVCVLAGVALAARDIAGIMRFDWPLLPVGEKLSYLSNSPLVLMSAITLGGYGMNCVLSARRAWSFIVAMLCFLAMLIPLIAMGFGLQRASLGLFGVSMVILLFAGLVVRPVRAGILILILGVVIWATMPFALGILFSLMDKSSQVGFNMRAEELQAVWSLITYNNGTDPNRIHYLSFLAGMGWGGTFQSPAVGMMQVNFTHGLVASALLKTGVIGLFLYGLYLFSLTSNFVGLRWGVENKNDTNRFDFMGVVILLGLVCPFLIDVFLYAAFKSLDFGLLLLLMTIHAGRNAKDGPDTLVKDAKVP